MMRAKTYEWCPLCGAAVQQHCAADGTCSIEAVVPRWISMEERVPTLEEAQRCHTVMVRYEGMDGEYDTYYDAYWLIYSGWSYYDGTDWRPLEVSHWLWLPETPPLPHADP